MIWRAVTLPPRLMRNEDNDDQLFNFEDNDLESSYPSTKVEEKGERHVLPFLFLLFTHLLWQSVLLTGFVQLVLLTCQF